MLWERERHAPIVDEPWSEAAAREGIRELCADAEAAFDDATLWPQHPSDDPPDPGPRACIYLGASGVAWALAKLTGDARRRDFVDAYLKFPETGDPMPSLMLGEVGVRAVADAGRDRIAELIEANIEHDSLEVMFGGPGTMLVALFLFERTGEQRWRDIYLRNAEYLLRTFEYHADFDVWMWTQTLYAERVRLLGASHGFAGNVCSLLRGAALLSPEQHARIVERAVHTLKATVLRDGELANWLPHVGTPRQGREKILVQWCHGAPGMILALSRLPRDAELDAMFVAAAETIWRAGPLAKGSGLCHGTAGNGYAFLAMYERTGDERYLERARRFAIHALSQVRAARREHGRGRYTLWTGDLGVAMFLAACVDGTGELPIISYF